MRKKRRILSKKKINEEKNEPEKIPDRKSKSKEVTTESSIKCKLNTALSDYKLVHIIKEKVVLTNQIFMQAYLLVNFYVLDLLETNKEVYIDNTTIIRCASIVSSNKPQFRCKDDEVQKLMEAFQKLSKKVKLVETNGYKGLDRPLTYLSNQIMDNIKNHCSIHFWKYQRKYVYSLVCKNCNSLSLTRHLLTAITACIQYHLTNGLENINILSKKILKHDKLDDIQNIIKRIVSDELKKIPNEFRNKDNKIMKFQLRTNYNLVFKYYSMIIKHLEANDFKRFSILPQLSLGLKYIRFDKRSLVPIYNEWKNDNIHCKAIEKNYMKYSEEMFNFTKHKKLKEKNNKFGWEYPISISTNGYSVSLTYTKREVNGKEINNKLDKDQKNSKTKSIKKIDLSKKNIKKGLYDADKCKCSEEFLSKYHKIGIDPNNDDMIVGVSETGKGIKITKGYYKHISHINKTTVKLRKLLMNSKMYGLYRKLSSTTYKTCSLEKYLEYSEVLLNNWDKLWNFYSRNKVLGLEFERFVHKKRAISLIVRKIVPKKRWIDINKKINLDEGNPYFDTEKYDEIKYLPILVAFGKGNGNITISNLRNKDPKGPIKRIAIELAKYCLVFLTDEFRTSKICSACKENILTHPNMDHTKKGKIKKRKCHKLGYCKNNIHLKSESNVPKFWQRDTNAARNILDVMKNKLLGKNLGFYSRRIKDLSKKIPKSINKVIHKKRIIINNKKDNKIANNISKQYKIAKSIMNVHLDDDLDDLDNIDYEELKKGILTDNIKQLKPKNKSTLGLINITD